MVMSRAEAGKLGGLKARARTIERAQQAREDAQAAYALAGKACKQCLEPLPYAKRHGEFCDQSCSASWSGKHFPKRKAKVRVCKDCPSQPLKNRSYCTECIAKGAHLHRNECIEECSSDSTRKSYLVRTRPHQCESCAITEWQGQPVPLEMDHIDGDSSRNVESNLRLICPNCHALSPFHKGKNRGRGRPKRAARYHDGKTY